MEKSNTYIFFVVDNFLTTDKTHVYNRISEYSSVLYIDNGHLPKFVLIQVPQKRDVFCYLDVSAQYYIFIIILHSSVYEFPWRRTDRDGKCWRRENREKLKRHERSLRVIVARWKLVGVENLRGVGMVVEYYFFFFF